MISMSGSPLGEKIVMVTRAAAQSGELCEELNARGARVRLLPLVSFASPENCDALDRALTGIEFVYATGRNPMIVPPHQG